MTLIGPCVFPGQRRCSVPVNSSSIKFSSVRFACKYSGAGVFVLVAKLAGNTCLCLFIISLTFVVPKYSCTFVKFREISFVFPFLPSPIPIPPKTRPTFPKNNHQIYKTTIIRHNPYLKIIPKFVIGMRQGFRNEQPYQYGKSRFTARRRPSPLPVISRQKDEAKQVTIAVSCVLNLSESDAASLDLSFFLFRHFL